MAIQRLQPDSVLQAKKQFTDDIEKERESTKEGAKKIYTVSDLYQYCKILEERIMLLEERVKKCT